MPHFDAVSGVVYTQPCFETLPIKLDAKMQRCGHRLTLTTFQISLLSICYQVNTSECAKTKSLSRKNLRRGYFQTSPISSFSVILYRKIQIGSKTLLLSTLQIWLKNIDGKYFLKIGKVSDKMDIRNLGSL